MYLAFLYCELHVCVQVAAKEDFKQLIFAMDLSPLVMHKLSSLC